MCTVSFLLQYYYSDSLYYFYVVLSQKIKPKIDLYPECGWLGVPRLVMALGRS